MLRQPRGTCLMGSHLTALLLDAVYQVTQQAYVSRVPVLPPPGRNPHADAISPLSGCSAHCCPVLQGPHLIAKLKANEGASKHLLCRDHHLP